MGPPTAAAGGYGGGGGAGDSVAAMTRETSPLEAKMERLLWCYEISGYEREYKFALPERQFRADFAFVTERVLIEVDGGQWHPHGGRHNTDRDREKLNIAAALGWKVLRFSGAMLDRPDECASIIRKALEGGNDGTGKR